MVFNCEHQRGGGFAGPVMDDDAVNHLRRRASMPNADYIDRTDWAIMPSRWRSPRREPQRRHVFETLARLKTDRWIGEHPPLRRRADCSPILKHTQRRAVWWKLAQCDACDRLKGSRWIVVGASFPATSVRGDGESGINGVAITLPHQEDAAPRCAAVAVSIRRCRGFCIIERCRIGV